jgi:hypothetical protein
LHDNGPMRFAGGALEVPLNETQELELASELLEVASEQELDQFLGHVFQASGNAVGRFMPSETAHAVGAILKDAAARALPLVGRAVGQRVAPGRGDDTRGQLAQAAGAMLGLELEGLSPQDQEFEAARQFVRLAGATTHQALLTPPALPSQAAARQAAATAGERFAPGLAQAVWHGSRRPMRRGDGMRRPSGPRYAPRPASGRPRPGVRAGAYARRPIAPGARPGGARYGGARYGFVRYGGPYGPRNGTRYGAPPPSGPDSQRSWRSGYQRYGHGLWPPRATFPDSSWLYGDQAGSPQQYRAAPAGAPVEGAIDWSRRLYFFGPSPPPAPPGAPGRWVYGGRHRRRRRWLWVPIPGVSPFLWATPAAYATAPPFGAASEPEPLSRGPADATAMPVPSPQPYVEPTSAAPTNGATPTNGTPQMDGAAEPDGSGSPMAPASADPAAQNGAAPAQQGT